jgi:hypothetical protein
VTRLLPSGSLLELFSCAAHELAKQRVRRLAGQGTDLRVKE